MSDEVSNPFVAVLAIHDADEVSFWCCKHHHCLATLCYNRTNSHHQTSKDGTPSSDWNKLYIRGSSSQADRFILRFPKTKKQKHVLGGGPWFYGQSLFVMAAYDGLSDVTNFYIDFFPVWINIPSMPPSLMT
ncbi:hypothetical protein ACLB2K_060073 [Fragaria x ananassa]